MDRTERQGRPSPPGDPSHFTAGRTFQITGSDLVRYGFGIGASAIIFASAVLVSAVVADWLFNPKRGDPSAAFALATILTGMAVTVWALWRFWKPRLYRWLGSREVLAGDGDEAWETIGDRLSAWDFRTYGEKPDLDKPPPDEGDAAQAVPVRAGE